MFKALWKRLFHRSDIQSVLVEAEGVKNREYKVGEIAVGEIYYPVRFLRPNGDDLLMLFLRSDLWKARARALKQVGQEGETAIKDIFEDVG